MKIVAEYDPSTGIIKDSIGSHWTVGMNIAFEEYDENKEVESKETRLTIEDILKLKRENVI